MKYCKKCSSILSDSDQFCANCGEPVNGESDDKAAGGTQGPAPGSSAGQGGPSAGQTASVNDYDAVPPKYTVQSVLTLLFCCWPFAIPALVYGSKVDKLYYQGQKAEAWEASKNAKKWCIVSCVCGAAYILIVTVIAVIMAVMGNLN
jgi:hypothetical protein